MSDVTMWMHYHDNDGLPDQLEVVEAPAEASVRLELLQQSSIRRLHIHGGNVLVFGTPGLGEGRVAYEVYAWDHRRRCLDVLRLRQPPTDCEDCEAPDVA